MAVKIRLKKTGKKNGATYRIIVVPQTSGRDSASIEELGYYDPRRSDERINIERYDYWCSVGALPSETVAAIAKRTKAGKPKTLADHKAAMAEKEAAKPTKRRARKEEPVAEEAAPVEETAVEATEAPVEEAAAPAAEETPAEA